jgi:hypothetical protein
MNFTTELKKSVKAAITQFTSSSNQRPLGFTPNFYEKAEKWGLTEADATYVYYHGTEIKPFLVVKDYNGYSIGLYYFKHRKTGKPIISTIWKRDRR